MGEPQVNFSVNGHSQVPPGFRFHPTEEELLRYYLRKKVNSQKIDLDVIPEVDLNKLEPWDIQERCRIGSGPQNDWYFFSHKDKKYPTGTRTNRATVAGFWKATGRDKAIYSNSKRIGMRKTLVFYKGRAPHGQKSDWIMHEYRLELDDHSQDFNAASGSLGLGETTNSEDGWVVCRVFKKKNYLKAVESSQTSCNSLDTTSTLDGLLVYMKRSCKYESDNLFHTDFTTNQFNLHEGFESEFKHLPRLENPLSLTSAQENNNSSCYSVNLTDQCVMNDDVMVQEMDGCGNRGTVVSEYDHQRGDAISDWAALDRLVASQLNGQPEVYCQNGNENEEDFWSFGRSLSSDPLCHLSS